MLQGTASDVGKTILSTALCRIFKEDGYGVAPFKAQNMTLNSYITDEGLEMGIAQALQAQGAGVEPQVEMNPIILKPKGDLEAQVIVLGKPLKDMTAKAYRREYLPQARGIVQNSLKILQAEYELIIMEGAGSPVEVNLKDGDIVNMAAAEMADAAVILVADIDRGGVFASVIGTLELLTPRERERVIGLIINKFRGDLDLFQSGIEFLEERTGKPVLGVIPYIEHGLGDEDSTSLNSHRTSVGEMEILVLQLPRIANFADFQLVNNLPGVALRYIKGNRILDLGRNMPAAVIIPDTNSPMDDLAYIKAKGYHRELEVLARQGVPILGIGSGSYLLGQALIDHDGRSRQKGLGLLAMETTLTKDGMARPVQGSITNAKGEPWDHLLGTEVRGFALVKGQVELTPQVNIYLETPGQPLLIGSPDGLIMGTELQQFFNNRELLLAWLNQVRRGLGLAELAAQEIQGNDPETAFSQLADHVRRHLNMPLLLQLAGLEGLAEECPC